MVVCGQNLQIRCWRPIARERFTPPLDTRPTSTGRAWVCRLWANVSSALSRGASRHVLGDPDQLHTYTFIGDFGRALAVLGERDEALGEVWHVPSAPTMTTRQFIELIAE